MSTKPESPLTDDQKAEMAACIADIQQERSEASVSLSTQARAISYGVLAIVWLLVSGSQEDLATRFGPSVPNLLWIGFLCILGLLLDFLQYAFSLWESDQALKASLKATKPEDVGWNEGDWKRWTLSVFFCGKIAVTLTAAIWLLWIMYSGLAPR